MTSAVDELIQFEMLANHFACDPKVQSAKGIRQLPNELIDQLEKVVRAIEAETFNKEALLKTREATERLERKLRGCALKEAIQAIFYTLIDKGAFG